MKKNWNKLWEKKCPTIGCITKGTKTKLIGDDLDLSCPKCKGSWTLTIYSPMDIAWVEITKPQFIKNNNIKRN